MPVTKLTSTPLVIVINPALGVKTWQGYLALAAEPRLLLLD